MSDPKSVNVLGEKGEPVIATDSPAADPDMAKAPKRVEAATDRPLYEWEVDAKKQVGPAALQKDVVPAKVKSARRS